MLLVYQVYNLEVYITFAVLGNFYITMSSLADFYLFATLCHIFHFWYCFIHILVLTPRWFF